LIINIKELSRHLLEIRGLRSCCRGNQDSKDLASQLKSSIIEPEIEFVMVRLKMFSVDVMMDSQHPVFQVDDVQMNHLEVGSLSMGLPTKTGDCKNPKFFGPI
jgi:hypothetical protein